MSSNRAQASSRLLVDEPPLVVLPSLAARFGLLDAMILQQVQYWLSIAQRRNETDRHFIDGRWWVYNTVEGWAEQFPFVSEKTVKRSLFRLRDLGILIGEQHGQNPMDRTLWYAVDYDALDAFVTGRADPDDPMRMGQDDPMQLPLDDPMQVALDDPMRGDTVTPCSYTETTTETTSRDSPEPQAASEDEGSPSLFSQGSTQSPQTDAKPSDERPDPPSPAPSPRRKPKVKAAEKVWDHDGREYRAALFLYHRLAEAGAVAVQNVERKGKREAEVQAWAGEFDRMVRLDGASWDDVAVILRWLLDVDDWWVPAQFQTARKLRQKNREGLMYHEVFLGRAIAAMKQTAGGKPSPEQQDEMFERMKAEARAHSPRRNA